MCISQGETLGAPGAELVDERVRGMSKKGRMTQIEQELIDHAKRPVYGMH